MWREFRSPIRRTDLLLINAKQWPLTSKGEIIHKKELGYVFLIYFGLHKLTFINESFGYKTFLGKSGLAKATPTLITS